jgi:hypothetical protein
MTRVKLWKLFRLPSPKDLGWTDCEHNALPMALFKRVGDDTPTWEDWDAKMRKEYPVRYFFAETVPFWFRTMINRRIKDSWYWVKCHLLPSHRYHILDLRQPKSEATHNYTWGWIDSDTKMLYALFNILNTFVEKELPHMYCPSEEDVQKESHLLHQRNHYLEIKAIHYWWNIERLRQNKAHAEMQDKWSEAKQANDPIEHQYWDQLRKIDAANEAKEDEMIGRLIKIRRSLWT